MTRITGIDVSHFQSTKAPGGVPWSLLKQDGCAFAIIRATYGTYRDPSAVEHMRAARAVGMQVGLYHFFRVGQPVTEQVAAFCGQALACGYRVGDIAPALDLEDDPKVAEISPAWDMAARAMTDGLVANFGDCLIYITQRDFGRLGKPAWVLERPLWTAHYTAAPKPATPGNKPCAIWQHRVGPYEADGPGGAYQPMVLDQDRADGPMPLTTRVAGASGSTPPPPAGPEPEHTAGDLASARLDAMTNAAYAGLDLSHDAESSNAFFGDEPPTSPTGDAVS